MDNGSGQSDSLTVVLSSGQCCVCGKLGTICPVKMLHTLRDSSRCERIMPCQEYSITMVMSCVTTVDNSKTATL